MKKNIVVGIVCGLIVAPTFALLLVFGRCAPPKPSPPDAEVMADTSTAAGTTVLVANETGAAEIVNVSFGSDSVVKTFPFCEQVDGGGCQFPLRPHTSRALPISGQYLNATIAFGGSAVGCGTTKAELNINNPNWYDTIDVSMVDGYSNRVMIEVANPTLPDAGITRLGPPNGRTGNETVYGVFPFGCDICVARQDPPCGIQPGTDGCKKGTQYNPDVPCQYQGPFMGGGSRLKVALVPRAQGASP
jgi:hypothetical protein